MPNPNKMALIMGMDVYDSNELEQLPACRKDAQDLYKLFITDKFDYTIFKNEPIIGSKLDKEYGWAQVRADISNFFSSAKPSQTLVFYFSGHGIPDGNDVYLATRPVDPRNPFNKGFALSDLTKVMGLCKSKQLVAIIDAMRYFRTRRASGPLFVSPFAITR